MFVWGYIDKEVPIAAEVSDKCPRCQVMTPHHLKCEYQIVHLYVWLRSVKSEKTIATCDRCGLRTELVGEKRGLIDRLPSGDPIPIFDRYGSNLLVLLVLALFIWFMVTIGA